MNYTEMESKVREATNDEAWGPTGQLMQEIAQATFSYEYFPEVMSMLWRRMLVDNQQNWRRTYKSLVVLNYLVKNGAERVVTSAREHIYDLKTLENFAFIDENGKDCGLNVRIRVKQLIDFIQDDETLREERKKAKKNRDKYVGVSSDGSTSSTAIRFNNSFNDSLKFEDQPKAEGKRTRSNNNNVPTTKNISSSSNAKKSYSDEGPQDESPKEVEPKVVTEKKVLAPRVEAQQPVLDLFGECEGSPQLDGLQTVKSDEPQAMPSGEDNLKEIVKNIDIFSSKRPRPQKSNKSSIPDLTLKNPNMATSQTKKMSKSSPNEPQRAIQNAMDQKKALSSLNDIGDVSFLSPSEGLSTSTDSDQMTTLKPVDDFDLLSAGVVPSATTTTQTREKSIRATVANDGIGVDFLNDLSSLNLSSQNDDPFGLDHMPSNVRANIPSSLGAPVAMAPQVSNLLPNPINVTTLTPSTTSNLREKADAAPITKLPETWNSLVSGTKFNIDLDNLLKPDHGRGAKPSLNQLAQTKPTTTSDDLFG